MLNNFMIYSSIVTVVKAKDQNSQVMPSSGFIVNQNSESLQVLRFESKDTLGTRKNDASFVIGITDMYMAGPWQTAIPDDMHAVDPDSIVIVYRDFMNIKEGLTEWYRALENDWVLRDENGDYVYAINYPINKIADRGSPSFMDWMADLVQSYIDMGFDGVFCDNAIQVYPNTDWTMSARPINPRTGELYTDREWSDDCINFINHIKNEVPEALLICNGMPFTGRAFYRDQPELERFFRRSEMDGKFIEGTFNNFNDLYSESDWKKSVDMIVWFQENYLNDPDKYLVIWSQSRQIPDYLTPNQMSSFIFTSSLLGVSRTNQNYISLHGNMDSAFSQSLFDIDLGVPMEDYHKIDGTKVYERQFSKVRVLVNPTNTDYTLHLGLLYLDLNGNEVSSITIQAYSGTILTPVS
jgi:hypothetical protein